jgi:probable HAF family extracellular repeat protein
MIKSRLIAGLALVSSLVLCSAAMAAPPRYFLEEIGPLPGKDGIDFYIAHDINDHGDVLASASAGSFLTYPFIKTATGFQELTFADKPGDPRVEALNNNGVVVGHFHNDDMFRYEGGSWETLPGLAGVSGYATDINDADTIVGYGYGLVGGVNAMAYRLNGSNLELLGVFDSPGTPYSRAHAVNESGVVAGYGSADDGYPANYSPEHAFFYRNKLEDLGNLGGRIVAQGINDSGHIVGGSAKSYTSGGQHAFIFTGERIQGEYKLTELGWLPSYAPASLANDINNDGMVVGTSRRNAGERCCAVIFTAGEVHYLGDLVTNMGDWQTLIGATAINASGQIVGSGRKYGENFDRVFRLTLVTDVLPVAIDIQPNDANNFVETEGEFSDKMYVSVLGSNVLDAGQIDATTVRFGPAESAPHKLPGTIVDTNEDGYSDLKLTFRTGATGIVCEQIDDLVLTGEEFGGESITGSDSVTTPDCPSEGCHP